MPQQKRMAPRRGKYRNKKEWHLGRANTTSKKRKEDDMAQTVISMENVTKNYGPHKVLKGVSMNVDKGDVYGLIGKNGAGKTTMFKLLLGLSGSDSGNISICGGASIKENNANRRKIGFSLTPNFHPYLSGRENINYFRRMKGISDKKEVDRVLEIVGLEQQAARRKAGGYSMGMKQRLGIAQSLLGNPEILIFDEPTNGLDPQGILDIRKLIGKLNSEYGMTIIVSSHILDELQHTARRFGIINDGVMVAEMTQEDLLSKSGMMNITVREKDSPRAQKLLEDNGIEITEVEKKITSLEDFYFDLVGGDK